MSSPFDAIDRLFPNFAARCAGGHEAAKVTIKSIHPDSGAVLATAENVYALKRSRRRNPLGVGDGGELGSDKCRFIVRASEVGFYPKTRDQVVDNGGTTWEVETAEAIAMNNLYALNVFLKR